MVKWEYKSVTVSPVGFGGSKGLDVEEVFNELGYQGWELVGIIGKSNGGTASGGQAIFKRPKAV